jgi:hypothetical protein
VKKSEIPAWHFVIFERRWGQTHWNSALGGNFHLQAFSQVSDLWKIGKN